ncbi:MAG: zf-HC2 domain-containing protein [Burkholderiales bacterium]|nr:zf-HC2 domain-containing protein [Burkholderiales bacterium]
MTSCKKASELMSQGQDRALGTLAKLQLRLHLLICERCRRVTRQLEFLRAAIRRYRDGD